MVKHTQTTYLNVFGHFGWLAFKGLKQDKTYHVQVMIYIINLFHAICLFLYLLKTESYWFSEIFTGYGKRPEA